MPMLEGQIQPWGRVSQTLSEIPPPPAKQIFPTHCPGQGISDIAWDTPPFLLSKFSQLRHCLGQGILDIVQVRVSRTLSRIPPPPLPTKQIFPTQTLSGSECPGYLPPQSKFFQLRHCPGQGISDIVRDTPLPT